MAAGFKQATVDSSKVAGTLTNYPAFVDLSRIGITTQAEADSVRVYSDASKTTELAREIVSVNEMHVKIPSLTTTTTIYVDYDGVRSNYANTDTYGRNAVWTGYDIVLHCASLTDSTGKHTITETGTVAYGTGKIGNGFSIPNTANYPLASDASDIRYTGDMYYSAWLKRNSNTTRDSPFSKGQPWTSTTGYWMHFNETNNVIINKPNTSYSNVVLGILDVTSALTHFVYKKTASTNMKVYSNGSLLNTVTTNATGAFGTNTNAMRIGNRTDGNDYWDGILDEQRFSATLYSDNWITTEYNNQNDESTFWGTWTNVSTFTPQAMWFM